MGAASIDVVHTFTHTRRRRRRRRIRRSPESRRGALATWRRRQHQPHLAGDPQGGGWWVVVVSLALCVDWKLVVSPVHATVRYVSIEGRRGPGPFVYFFVNKEEVCLGPTA